MIYNSQRSLMNARTANQLTKIEVSEDVDLYGVSGQPGRRNDVKSTHHYRFRCTTKYPTLGNLTGGSNWLAAPG